MRTNWDSDNIAEMCLTPTEFPLVMVTKTITIDRPPEMGVHAGKIVDGIEISFSIGGESLGHPVYFSATEPISAETAFVGAMKSLLGM